MPLSEEQQTDGALWAFKVFVKYHFPIWWLFLSFNSNLLVKYVIVIS
jgi:hypothetical protein